MFKHKTFGLFVSFLLVFSLLVLPFAYAQEESVLPVDDVFVPVDGVLPIDDVFVPLNAAPVISFISYPKNVERGGYVSVSMGADDVDGFVRRFDAVYAGSVLRSVYCADNAFSQCTTSFNVNVPAGVGSSFVFSVFAVDDFGAMSAPNDVRVSVWPLPASESPSKSACFSGYQWRFSPSDSAAFGCSSGSQAVSFCNDKNEWAMPVCAVFPSSAPVAPAPSPSPAPSPAPLDAAPVISSFVVPSSADKGANVVLSVTAADDSGVDKIEISKDSSVVSSQSCGSVLSCTKSFIVAVPDAFDAVYTFVAKVFDVSGASVSASGSGKTKSAPAVPPVVLPPVVPPVIPPAPAPDEVLKPVDLQVVRQALFVSGLVPDSSCVAPGADTFLFASLRNRGSASLKDVKVTAYVDELGVYASSGSFKIGSKGSASRFVYFSVPEGAVKGEYYMRVVVSSQKDSVVRYVPFEVNPSC